MLTSETIRLKSGRSWQIHGGGTGPELLWLHGLGGVDPADPLLAALGAGHRIIAPTAPGYLDLDELEDIDNLHELVLDYDDLLRALRLGSLAIAGHSLGAMVAAEIAAHFPDLAAKLVLLAPVGLWNDAYPIFDVFALPTAEMDEVLWHDAAARAAHAARGARPGADQTEQMIATTRALASATKFIWPIPDKGLRRRLRRITAPTLVVFGAEDGFVPPGYAADFCAGIAAAQSAVVAGAGHMVPYERTTEVAALIERFLAQP